MQVHQYIVEKLFFKETYYKIRLSSDTIEGSFKPVNRTRLHQKIESGDNVVCVDSTVGFAKSSFFNIGRRRYDYTDKTLTLERNWFWQRSSG